MANRYSDPNREAMLRRVAIVLSSLPAPVANQLLGSIGPESKKAVRRTMTSLADVDPLERKRALQAFKVSVQRQPVERQPVDRQPVELTRSRHPADTSQSLAVETIDEGKQQGGNQQPIGTTSASKHLAASTVNFGRIENSNTSTSSPLAFLADIDDDTLVHLIKLEHPQAVALVLASIAPAQAARVIPRLDPNLQSEALSRIGRLGDVPDAAAAEVAEHFKTRMSQSGTIEKNNSGQRALDAILAAMPSETADVPPELDAVALQHSAAAEWQQGMPPNQVLPTASQEPTPRVSFPSSNLPKMDLTQKLRIAENSWRDESATTEAATTHDRQTNGTRIEIVRRGDQDSVMPSEVPSDITDSDGSPSQEKIAPDASELDSTDAIHQHLLRLSPIELCQALGKVDARDAMLTLCGLPNEVTESALAVLPRAQAKKVRVQMSSLSSLHLREIDDAKEKVARQSMSQNESTQAPLAA